MTNKDNPAEDIKTIVSTALHRCRTRALRSAEVRLDHVSEAEHMLMQDLVIFIAKRDQKVFEHAYALGKKDATTSTN